MTPARRRAVAGLPAFVLFAILVAAVRIQTFGYPALGYDEQFYLLVGDRMLHGAVPYVDIFDRKPVGLFLIFAASRLLGGAGFLQYQLLAAVSVAGTATLIARMAARITHRDAALCAAALYVLWQGFLECEGGQSPVFFNLFMAAAGWLTWTACRRDGVSMARGCGAMLAVGIALQIKYSVVFEGIAAGLALCWASFRAGDGVLGVAWRGLVWAALALLPTGLIMAWYEHAGALDAFVFANFSSIFGRVNDAMSAQWPRLLLMLAIFAPLFALAARGQRVWPARTAENNTAYLYSPRAFLLGWLVAAIGAVMALGIYLNGQYAANVLLPLTALVAPAFADGKWGKRLAIGLLAFFFVAAQIVEAITISVKGSRAEIATLTRAAAPAHGCMWIYDGWPALYMLTHSCVPTKYAFPGQLNTREEASAAALGVDPVAETRRILAARPEVILDTAPAYKFGNAATHAVVLAALARDYRLTYRMYSDGGWREVFRRRDTLRAAP